MGFATQLAALRPKPAPQPAPGGLPTIGAPSMPPAASGAPNINPVAAGPPPVLTATPAGAGGGMMPAPPSPTGTITADNVPGAGAPASLGGQSAYGGTVTVGNIDPKTGLRGQTVLPGAQSVDRQALTQQALADYDTGAAPQLNATMRHATQLAAANGRMGSGMLTTDYGNAVSDYQRNRMLFGNDLMRGATEGSINDARNTRDELRTERGYQDSLANSALDQKYRERTLGDAEMQSQFGRDLSRSQLAMQGGTMASETGRQAADALAQFLNYHRQKQATAPAAK